MPQTVPERECSFKGRSGFRQSAEVPVGVLRIVSILKSPAPHGAGTRLMLGFLIAFVGLDVEFWGLPDKAHRIVINSFGWQMSGMSGFYRRRGAPQNSHNPQNRRARPFD